VIVFEDEASFRQTPTLHATWAKRGSQPQIPTRGERHTQKIFGAVRLDNAGFIYLHQEDYFQWETYLAFLEQVVVPALPPSPPNLPDSRQCFVSQKTGNP
jgi:hypothetical protein